MLQDLLKAGIVDIETIRPQATPFALLGLEPTFDIDPKKLDFHYFCLQKELHPDRFVGKTVHEAQSSQMMSSWVNTAYNKLKDPVLRAQSLIKIMGAAVPGEKDTPIQDAALLVQVMEWREELEGLQSPGDVDDFCLKFQDKLSELGEQFSANWKERDIKSMKQSYLQMIYVSKIMEDAKDQKQKY